MTRAERRRKQREALKKFLASKGLSWRVLRRQIHAKRHLSQRIRSAIVAGLWKDTRAQKAAA